MTHIFNPTQLRSSMQGWTGDFYSVKDVQEKDYKKLEEIAGSYEAIADRMRQCTDFSESQIKERTFVPEYKWVRLRVKFPQTHLDDKIAVIQGLTTRGEFYDSFMLKWQETS